MVLEKRKLDRQIGDKQDMIEVIVVIPESGLPLAFIPTTADEYRTWKEVLHPLILPGLTFIFRACQGYLENSYNTLH